MATVRISAQLVGDVCLRVRGIFRARADRYEADNFKKEWGEQVVQLMYRDLWDKFQAVPEGFLSTTRQLCINTPYQLLSFYTTGEFPMTNNLDAATECLSMMGLRTYRGGYSSLEVSLDPDDARWADILPEMYTYAEEHQQLKDAEPIRTMEAKTMLQKFSTLAPALKAWPALWDLLDEDIKNRHRKVNERSKREDVSNDDLPDLGDITSAIVANRISKQED